MSRSIAVVVICLAASLFLFSRCGAPSRGPSGESPGGWKPFGPPQEYEGEALFIYINGGADIYYEYGFDKVRVQEYKNGSGKAISLEIYEMKGARGAYGIYSFKRGTDGEVMDLGNEGFFEGYYLNFWKGNVLVTLTGFDTTEETIEGLKQVAKTVDDKLPPGGEVPALVGALEAGGLIKPSVKYFLGPLGLYNSYTFFTEDVFDFEEAAAGTYETMNRVFIFGYANERIMGERFESIRDAFRGSARYRDYETHGDTFSVLDRDERRLSVHPNGNRIILKIYRIYRDR